MKKAQALEQAYKQGAAPEAAGKDGSEGSDNEEDEDKIAEEKEAGVRGGGCDVYKCSQMT